MKQEYYFEKISHEERVALAVKAGRASGQSKRERRKKINELKLQQQVEKERAREMQKLIHKEVKQVRQLADALLKTYNDVNNAKEQQHSSNN